MMLSIFLLLPIIIPSSSINILVYSPAYAASHTNFMARLADTLTEAGHNVTFFVPIADERRRKHLGVKVTKDIIEVERDEEMKQKHESTAINYDFLWTIEMNSEDIDKMFSGYDILMQLSCANLLRNQKVYEELKTRHFDVAITEPFHVCGMGYFEALGIKKTILVSSCTHYDFMLPHIGEPEEFSYVPTLSSKVGEKMTMMEKYENYRLVAETKKSVERLFDAETRMYREKFGNDIADWKELSSSASLYFTNSMPFIDYPRPTIQKTVAIGGITVDMDKIKKTKVSEEWNEVLNRKGRNVLISFGSSVPSMNMPKIWRQNILEMIKTFPDVTFIWKYESNDTEWAKGVKNVYFNEWVPQLELLGDKRITAFITHGGLGSTNELAHAGVPAIMIPIFGDQHRNANMLARHGGVIVMLKKQLEDIELLKRNVDEIINNKEYDKSAKRIADMLAEQPNQPQHSLVKYTEYVAKYGPFPQMDPHGRQLNWFQKNFIDVYAYLSIPYLFLVIILFFVIRFILSKLTVNHPKND